MNRPFAYKRENRLKKKADIEACFKKGRQLRASFFRAYYIPSEITRLGISVTSRHGNAVFRNSVKRTVREFFRKSKDDFPECFDIVIVLSKRPPDGLQALSDLKRIFKCLENIKPSSEK